MKNKFGFIALLALLFAAIPAFSEDEKIKEPGKNEVVLVGKFVVKASQDMDFIAKTRNLSNEEKKGRANYTLPFAPVDMDDIRDDYDDFKKANKKLDFDEGQFFYATFKVNKKTRNLEFVYPVKYRFFGSEKTFIYIPFDFNIDIPEGIQAAYIGSFYCETKGKDFAFSSIKNVDEYDAAQEALNRVAEKKLRLYRANIKENIHEEAKKK